MDLKSKFDLGDYAWFKYDNEWYMIEINSVIVTKAYNGVTNEPYTHITYTGWFKEITGKPKSLPPGSWNAFSEEELYETKGS